MVKFNVVKFYHAINSEAGFVSFILIFDHFELRCPYKKYQNAFHTMLQSFIIRISHVNLRQMKQKLNCFSWQ